MNKMKIMILKYKKIIMNTIIRQMISTNLIVIPDMNKNIMIIIRTITNNYIINFKIKKFQIIIM